MLGQQVMPDFQPEESTSEEVMCWAIEPLCVLPPSLEEYPIEVEVLEIRGLQHLPSRLVCSILHLGTAARCERPCMSEQRRGLSKEAGVLQCCRAKIFGLQPEHAVAFALADADGQYLGTACVSAERVLKAEGWSGELTLHPNEPGTSLGQHGEAARVPALDVKGSQGRGASLLPGVVSLSVRIWLPAGYCYALAMNELQQQKSRRPQHHSEVTESHSELKMSLVSACSSSELQAEQNAVSSAFCGQHSRHEGSLAPEVMVVHSCSGKFLHLVCAVLADALGEGSSYAAVRELILEKDFHGLLDLLGGAGGKRYFIDIFAVNAAEYREQQDAGTWHQDFLSSWPTILRAMRQAACRRAVAEIEAGHTSRPVGPLLQLLVLDRDFQLTREVGCLAELMLARAMRVRQRMVLHPSHLQGPALSQEMKRLAEELVSKAKPQCYTAPFLEDRQAVYDAVRDLVVARVTEETGGHDSVWQELSLTNLVATLGAVPALRSEPEALAGDVAGGDDIDITVD